LSMVKKAGRQRTRLPDTVRAFASGYSAYRSA
jgi:hypothetical protein